MLIIEELIKPRELSLPLIQCDRLGLITLFEHIAGISLLRQRELSNLEAEERFPIQTRQGQFVKGSGLMKGMLKEWEGFWMELRVAEEMSVSGQAQKRMLREHEIQYKEKGIRQIPALVGQSLWLYL